MNKKAISPVVATALLLVVAVVAVVGFQTWFNTYQSSLNSKIEQESQAGSALTIERLEASANSTIYVKNSGVDAVNVTSWKVMDDGSQVCAGQSSSVASATGQSITSYDGAAGCTTALNTGAVYDVVVISNSGVFSASLIAR